jgi:hypothetical protein
LTPRPRPRRLHAPSVAMEFEDEEIKRDAVVSRELAPLFE